MTHEDVLMKVEVNATALGYIPAIVPSKCGHFCRVYFLDRRLHWRFGRGTDMTMEEARKYIRYVQRCHNKLAAEAEKRKRSREALRRME